MIFRSLCLLLLLIVSITACKSRKNLSSTSDHGQIIYPEGFWNLVYVSGPSKSMDALYPVQKPELNLRFKDSLISGNNGCNTYRGRFSYQGHRIDFSQPLLSTKMACKGGGEALFMETLKKINQWSVRNDSLIFQMGSLEMMIFVRL
jgi:heat shock protein HslJ